MRNDYRYRPRRGREPEFDAVAVALTAQIILCVLLLIAAGVAKKVSEEGYRDFKREFSSLVGSESEGEKLAAYFAELGELGKGFFAAAENLIRGIQSGGGIAAEERRPPAGEESDAEIAGDGFDYGYLKAQGTASGNIRYQMSGRLSGQMMEAPEGSTLAPVFLAGSIKPPVTGPVTSAFAYRIHPISGDTDFHTGIDVAAPEGRGILSALPGEVIEVGQSDIYGNYIILRHAANLKTFYAHCSEIIAREGAFVRRGERIARVGQTGMATGPHLHFSVIVEERFTDPCWVLAEYLEPVE